MPAPVTVLRTGTGWTVDVTSLQLSADVGFKDIYVTAGGVVDPLANYTKTSASLLTYTGTALPPSTVVQVLRDSTRLVEDFMFSDINTSVGLNNRFTAVERVLEDLRIFFSVVGTLTATFNLTGTSTGVTAATGDNSTLVATTAFVKNNLVSYATIASLSAYATNTALGNYATLASLASYLTTSGAASTYSTIASLASYLTTSGAASTYATIAALGGYAPLSSPSLTGVPVAPTAAALTNTTQLATTAYSLDAAAIKQGAAVTVTAVANIDWAIPSGVRRITFVADQVVIPIDALLRFAVAGTFVTTGYVSNCVLTGANNGARTQATSGLNVPDTFASTTQSATVTLVRVGTTNTWLSSGSAMHGTVYVMFASGRVALAGEATSIQFRPPSGNFTAGGTVQIMWEY